jgi:hypothetical protein
MDSKYPACLPNDKEFIAQLKNSINVRRTIAEVLTKKYESAIIKEENGAFYHDSNAAVNVAYNGGYRKGLREALDLLTIFIKSDP